MVHYYGDRMPWYGDRDRYHDAPRPNAARPNKPLEDGFVRHAGAFDPVGDPFLETRQEAHLESRQK